MADDRCYSFLDKVCFRIDDALRTLSHHPKTCGRNYPGEKENLPILDENHRKYAAALMRINHAGEICAQGLYHGQGVISRTHDLQAKMTNAALEEGDHLVWCKTRLNELNSHTSYLMPFWYAGSFCIGMAAGMMGDDISLGFVVETERQVVKHLNQHLALLPKEDERSHAILKQMEEDEAKHRDEAIKAGAHELPHMIKKLMALTSKIMVKTTYWI